MPLTLPNLDDRRWSDLVEESRALIPVYGREWTDHNVHDPGITIVELLAYLAEIDIFRVNQITDSHKREFLALIGLRPDPPQPAQTLLTFELDATTPSLDLVAGLSFVTASDEPVRWQIDEAVTVAAGSIAALQSSAKGQPQDLTAAWRRGMPCAVFGDDPRPGAAFYIGFSTPLPAGRQIRIALGFAGEQSGAGEWRRIRDEAAARADECGPRRRPNPCATASSSARSPGHEARQETLVHPGVRTVWEIWTEAGGQAQWTVLDPATDQLRDDTRALTLSGTLTFRVPAAMHAGPLGGVPQGLPYIRCRFVAGAYDQAPSLTHAALNACVARQTMPLQSRMRIAPGARVQGAGPTAGDRVPLRLGLDTSGRINDLTFGGGDPSDPHFLILDYRPSSGAEGVLQIEAAYLGRTSGSPFDSFTLDAPPIDARGFRVIAQDGQTWHRWMPQPDLASSSSRDRHVLFSPPDGRLQFGDGKNGLLPAAGSLVFAIGGTTRAAAGNVRAHTVTRLENSTHNHALLGSRWSDVSVHLAAADNPLAASGGAAGETPDQASLRAIDLVKSRTRAVTADDFEQLALATPGVRLARALAIPDFHEHFPCFDAPGVVTVVVVPFLPKGAPAPSRSCRALVASYLNRRRLVGTSVRVVAPEYVTVSLTARVRALRGVDRAALQTRVAARLRAFLDPLSGGESGHGWPFGRHVYRADLLSVRCGSRRRRSRARVVIYRRVRRRVVHRHLPASHRPGGGRLGFR